jgi:hypothetical protein
VRRAEIEDRFKLFKEISHLDEHESHLVEMNEA